MHQRRESLRCEIVPLEKVYQLTTRLASEIRGEGFAPDLVVAIARGGFVPARLICDFLGVHDLTSMGVRHYASGARRQEQAQVTQSVGLDVSGRRVLVVDDVNDTGETLAIARAHLEAAGAAALRCGVVHEKSSTRFRADFRAVEVSKWHWLVYEWALVEDATGFLEQMEPPPASSEEARARLLDEFGLRLTQARWRQLLAFVPVSVRPARNAT